MNFKIVNGSISYGADTILEEINFEIKDKEKIAIVGRNGCGKTSLLKAIINNDILEEGVGESKFGVYKQGKFVIGYLKQIQFDDPNCTLLDEVRKVYKHVIDIEKKISEVELELKNNYSENVVKKYTNLLEQYEFMYGYTYKKEYETAIYKFGFTKSDFNKKIKEFSGGQKTKIALIKLVLSKPDILLLDEPTNNLDIETIEWLEMYLKGYPKSIVIVSHDRMFLDKIVNKVYEIEYASLNSYKGNFTAFEKQKRQNYEKQLKDYEYQQKEIERLKSIADRFRYKPTKAKMALSKLKKIEQMELVDEPDKFDLKTFKTNFDTKRQSGKLVLKLDDLSIGYDKPIANVSLELYRGQKLAIIGANGEGKSTLLKTIVGEISMLSGKVKYGHHVDMAYFDQQVEFNDENNTIIEEFSEEFAELNTTQIRSSLASFLFYRDDLNKQIKTLSGGEKVRLELCKILNKGPNLLILDEPTNHMDIAGKEALENLIKKYNGTFVIVSHDRYFINKIADSLLIFEKNKVKYFKGTYEDYINSRTTKQEENIVVKKEKNNNSRYIENKEKNRIKNKIKRIELGIEEKENQIKELDNEMQKEEICTDYEKLKELQEQKDTLEKEIANNMEEWEELNNKLDK